MVNTVNTAVSQDQGALEQVPEEDGAQGPHGALEYGMTRVVWVYRNRGSVILAIGRLFREPGDPGRAGRELRLLPFRRLMPGRYDLVMARYGEAWPVTLSPDPDAEDPRMMRVTGRVPL